MKIYLAGSPGGGTASDWNCRRERELNAIWKNRLHSYFYLAQGRGVEKPMKNKIDLFLDSGAFSAWTQNTQINLDDYIQFCLENLDFVTAIANLDVIPGRPYQQRTQEDIDTSAARGWENYQRMLKAGIPKDKLVHIFHQGEDMKWLKRMVKEIPYIGLSPANDSVTSQKVMWLDSCMEYVLDTEGFPLVKFHGFAVTSLQLMLRYPWYSVDSTSWVITGRLGSIYVPRYRQGEWIYDENSWKIAVSNRSPANKEAGKHLTTMTPREQALVIDYLASKGYKLGKSSFRKESQTYVLLENERWAEKKPKDKTSLREVETIEEEGVSNRYQLRDEVNILYFLDLEKSLPAWPWPFKIKRSGFQL